jgi:hypothetical protein
MGKCVQYLHCDYVCNDTIYPGIKGHQYQWCTQNNRGLFTLLRIRMPNGHVRSIVLNCLGAYKCVTYQH